MEHGRGHLHVSSPRRNRYPVDRPHRVPIAGYTGMLAVGGVGADSNPIQYDRILIALS